MHYAASRILTNATEIIAVIALCVGIVLVGILVLKLLDRLMIGRALSPLELGERETELDARLLQPQFAELEAYFEMPIPHDLRRLYTDTQLVLRRDFYLKEPSCRGSDHFIQHFLPADRRSVEDAWGRREMKFPFAGDDFGNYFFVPMTAINVDECPVFFMDCADGKAFRVADSLREFLWRENGADAKEIG